jgi:hypothetical protein
MGRLGRPTLPFIRVGTDRWAVRDYLAVGGRSCDDALAFRADGDERAGRAGWGSSGPTGAGVSDFAWREPAEGDDAEAAAEVGLAEVGLAGGGGGVEAEGVGLEGIGRVQMA